VDEPEPLVEGEVDVDLDPEPDDEPDPEWDPDEDEPPEPEELVGVETEEDPEPVMAAHSDACNDVAAACSGAVQLDARHEAAALWKAVFVHMHWRSVIEQPPAGNASVTHPRIQGLSPAVDVGVPDDVDVGFCACAFTPMWYAMPDERTTTTNAVASLRGECMTSRVVVQAFRL